LLNVARAKACVRGITRPSALSLLPSARSRERPTLLFCLPLHLQFPRGCLTVRICLLLSYMVQTKRRARDVSLAPLIYERAGLWLKCELQAILALPLYDCLPPFPLSRFPSFPLDHHRLDDLPKTISPPKTAVPSHVPFWSPSFAMRETGKRIKGERRKKECIIEHKSNLGRAFIGRGQIRSSSHCS